MFDFKKRKNPVIFLSIYTDNPIGAQHFGRIKEMLDKYSKENKVDFAIFNNTLVKPIPVEDLKELIRVVVEDEKKKEKRSFMPRMQHRS
jgi:hypothetical protein